MRVQVDTVETISDHRGAVFEPVSAAQLPRQRNVHVVLTEPGEVRGNHFHRLGTEVLAVMREEGELRDYEVPAESVHRFVLPPGTPHAIKNTGRSPILMVGFNTVEHDRERPDTFREVVIGS